MTQLYQIVSAAIFVVAAVYAIAQAYNGRNKKRGEDIANAESTINLLKDRADVLDQRVKELREDLKKEHDKVLVLETQLKLKDETIKQYLDILQNRDPELKSLLNDLRVAMDNLTKSQHDFLASMSNTKVTISHASPNG